MIAIGVVGSRRRDDLDSHREVIRAVEVLMLRYRNKITAIVSGGCPKGADRLAPLLAKKFGLTLVVHYPNWKRYGQAAPFVRNLLVADDASYLVAAVTEDRTGGTEDTIKKFLKRRPKRCLTLC